MVSLRPFGGKTRVWDGGKRAEANDFGWYTSIEVWYPGCRKSVVEHRKNRVLGSLIAHCAIVEMWNRSTNNAAGEPPSPQDSRASRPRPAKAWNADNAAWVLCAFGESSAESAFVSDRFPRFQGMCGRERPPGVPPTWLDRIGVPGGPALPHVSRKNYEMTTGIRPDISRYSAVTKFGHTLRWPRRRSSS